MKHRERQEQRGNIDKGKHRDKKIYRQLKNTQRCKL